MHHAIAGVLSLFFMLSPIAATASVMLTDVTVFSSNSEGNNWNGLIWNTQGSDTDPPNRYNLYLSNDPLTDLSPTFINGFNDSRARVALPLGVGSHTFSIYGEGVNRIFDPLQHFVLNLYFGGDQTAPGISGVQNLAGSALAPAGHLNGLDILGASGHPEAGTLAANVSGHIVSLTAFTWQVDGTRDVVWPHWANDAPYSGGSGTLDYYGSFSLSVTSATVPSPGTAGLVALGFLMAAARVVFRRSTV